MLDIPSERGYRSFMWKKKDWIRGAMRTVSWEKWHQSETLLMLLISNLMKKMFIVHYNIQNCDVFLDNQCIRAVLLIKSLSRSNIDQTLSCGLQYAFAACSWRQGRIQPWILQSGDKKWHRLRTEPAMAAETSLCMYIWEGWHFSSPRHTKCPQSASAPSLSP